MARRVGLGMAIRTTALAVAAAIAFGAAGGVTFANFTGTASSAGPTVTTKRIFSGARITPAWSIGDRAGGGTVTDSSSPLAFTDTRTTTSASAWLSTFSAARYLEFTMNSSLPGGIPVTGASFNFAFASTGAGSGCFYFDVRAPSTGAVVATHGSTGTPIGCATSAGASFTTPLPELTSSDLVNGVRIRVYETQSLLGTTATNLATVSGNGYAAFTMYPSSSTDASSGTGATAPWTLSAIDAVGYQVVSNWANNFSGTRYVDVAFPGYVPAGSVITQVQFTHTYKDVNNNSQCYYYDVIVGGTVLATHGSTTAPYCNTTSGYLSDVVVLPEIDTPAEANGVVIRMYGTNQGGAKRSSEDAALLSVTYSLT